MSSNDQKFHSSGPLNPIHFQKMNFRSCWHSPVFPPKTFYKTETRSFAWGKCWDAASGTALQAWDPWQALRARAGVQRGKGSGPTLWLSPCRPPLHPDTSLPCSYSRSFLIICERQQRSFFLCAGEVSRLTNSFTEKLEIGSLPFFSPPCVSVYCCLFLPFTILFPAWLAHCCLLVPPRTFFSVIFISSYFSWVFPYLLPSAPSLLFPCTAHLTLSAFYWPASERLVCCCFYFSFNQLQLDRGFPTPVQLVLHAATSFQPPSCLPAFDTVSLFFGLHGTAVLIFLLILRLSFLCLLHWVLFCHSFFKYNQSFRVPCSAFFPCYPDLGMNSSNPMTYFLRTVC